MGDQRVKVQRERETKGKVGLGKKDDSYCLFS